MISNTSAVCNHKNKTAMEILGFLKILGESIKVFLQNAKSIALITILSLLPSSILFLLFSYLYPAAKTYMTDSIMNSDPGPSILQIIAYFALLLSVELTFLFAYIAITHASGIATILASLASYSHTNSSLRDLYSSFKAKWKSPIKFRNNLRGSRKSMRYLWIVFVALGMAVPLLMFHPNPVAITVASLVAVSILIFHLYDSVVSAVAYVIAVVEDGCEAAEALEKAEKLVQGQRLHGFMVNLFLNLLFLIIGLGFWMMVGDQGSFNLMVYGLFLFSSTSISRIVVSVVYTVYYFQCMEYHAQNSKLLGNFLYTYSAVSNDIP